ncbi:TPA: IS982 family transposase, partial [Streptococcus equi subsp. zooepidemicus]|nr:IS982 family transposase [Streptococcus equi subsp. zooepidemicus]
MSRLQYTAKSHHLQWNMQQLSNICSQFYNDYCPEALKHRRNLKLAKVSDQAILTLLLLQAELGIQSQRHFYRICRLFTCGNLLERSRFNRRARHLIWLVQVIRQAMNNDISPDTILIMDSFPLVLCQPVRNHRVSIFNTVADIGYNASKNMWFY